MRCENCGYENDDKLYICENCGSPLYDEEELPQDSNGNTMIFNTNELNKVNTPNDDKGNGDDDKLDEKKKKQTIITIVVLAVVLISIIIGIIVGAVNRNRDNEPTTENTTVEQTTEEPTYSNNTTQPSTTTTTEPSTSQEMLTVGLSCNAGGEVEGDGEYELGENVTIIARPDDGYDFSGWYDGNTKVSSNTKYTFTITENVNLKAVFVIVQIDDESTTQAPTQTTTKPTTTTTQPSTTTTTEPTTQDNIDKIDAEDD